MTAQRPAAIRRGLPPLDRRTVLKGLLGGAAVSVALPWLEVFGSRGAWADGGALPRRFGIWSWGNGMVPSQWTPIGEGLDWQASPLLLPLDAHRDVISVVTGLEVKVVNSIPHYSGAAGFLTGIPPLGEEGDNTFAIPSLDQVIAAEIGGETRFRSLQVGAEPGTSGVSYNGPNSLNPPDTDPFSLYERLFGAEFRAPGDDRPVDPRLALRRSVLSAVMDQTSALQRRLGADDRARLEQHLTGVRDLEARLLRMEQDPPSLAACVRPDPYPPELTFDQISERHRLIADLMVQALACDQTRVFTMVLTSPVSNWQFPGASAGHHQLTHDEPGDQPEVSAIVTQAMHEAAYFIDALRRVPEGDGTLLDNMALLITSDVSLGRTHALDEWPVVLAGSCCGALRTGLHYRSTTRETASKVPLTLLRAMGIAATSYGEGDNGTTDGLSAVEA
jgi:hypothetical protein